MIVDFFTVVGMAATGWVVGWFSAGWSELRRAKRDAKAITEMAE
jgi:hypothetical protein